MNHSWCVALQLAETGWNGSPDDSCAEHPTRFLIKSKTKSPGQMVVPEWSCHTCIIGLIDGSIAYNPEPLERPAPGNGLVRCSQPSTGITLDL